jgi:hypothetical protein
VRQSLIGARAFYVGMYALFYLACILYRNKLTSSFTYALFWYLPLTALAWYLFVTAASNPGFLDEHPYQQTQNSVDDCLEDDIEMATVTIRRKDVSAAADAVDDGEAGDDGVEAVDA